MIRTCLAKGCDLQYELGDEPTHCSKSPNGFTCPFKRSQKWILCTIERWRKSPNETEMIDTESKQ